MSDSLHPRGLQSPWNSPGQNTGMGSLSFLQRIFPTQGLNPVFRIAWGFIISWDTRETEETGVGGLSLLQGIFRTQEWNWGLLHCRRILYQLSYQGGPLREGRGFNSSLSLFHWPARALPKYKLLKSGLMSGWNPRRKKK